jgi:hypothetical protein
MPSRTTTKKRCAGNVDMQMNEVGGSNGGTDSVNCVRDAAPPGGAVFDGVAGHDIEHQQPPKRIQVRVTRLDSRCVGGTVKIY